MKNLRILIIDDHCESCEALKGMIERRGGIAECASTMEEGQAKFEMAEKLRVPYHRVVSDLCLPHFSALDTIPCLTKFSRKTAVRALTGVQDPEIVQANAFGGGEVFTVAEFFKE